MKYFALMMLMASYTLAELPSINDCYSDFVTGSDPAIDLILVMLQQIKGDVAELTVKTDSLVATTDSLQTTVAGLSLKVRNIEDNIQNIEDDVLNNKDDIQNMEDDITDLKNTVETETGSMDPAIQQQITDLSSNVTALTEENEEIEQQVVDLSSKEQNDYDELNADITALNSTIQANYQELRGDIEFLLCGPLNNGYNYEWVDSYYTWNQARTNCQSKGGHLAYHGLDTLSGREQLLCGYFNLCDNGNRDDGSPYIGLIRDPTTGMFKYLDGELSPFDDQLWYSLLEYGQSGEDCAYLTGIEYNDPYFLQAASATCDRYYHPSICEFSC